MRRIVPAFFCFAAAVAPAAAAERTYSVSDFDRIQVDGPFEVSLATGRSSGARATGSADALEGVTVEVQGRTLRIHANHSAWGGYPGRPAGAVRIEASTRDLRTAIVIGSGSLSIDRAAGLRLDLALSGNGRLKIARVEADNLTVGLLGSGRIIAAGTAKQLKATIQGSGDFDGSGLRADDAQLNADTAGAISVTALRSASVRATGEGDVTVAGSPACTISGPAAARVRCGR